MQLQRPERSARPDDPPLIDNTRRLTRIIDRWPAYRVIGLHALRSISAVDIARSHFAFRLPNFSKPAFVTIEFTNYCNVRCPYCTSPTTKRLRGFISGDTIDRLVVQLRELGVGRVRIVGNGEALLHPDFERAIRSLASACAYLQIVSNFQRVDERLMRVLLDAPVRHVEISVDGDDKASYERGRVGGNFERVCENLERFKALRGPRVGATLIGLRVMLRPSDLPRKAAIVDFWRPYADVVMTQNILNVQADGTDTFHRDADAFPRCTATLTSMNVEWTGNVPLCNASAIQSGAPDGVVAGNVNDTTLAEIWNGGLFRQYREAQRRRDAARMPLCRGCMGQ